MTNQYLSAIQAITLVFCKQQPRTMEEIRLKLEVEETAFIHRFIGSLLSHKWLEEKNGFYTTTADGLIDLHKTCFLFAQLKDEVL